MFENIKFNPDKTLLLIDGSSYIYRAFHALPPLTSPNNEPVGALFAVISMLKKISQEIKFKYCCFVLDAKGKNFRHEIYSQYKANRAVMPSDLRVQISWIKEIVLSLGWSVLQVDNVEADDVISTLVKESLKKDLQVIISTSDKDLCQLVNEDVVIVDTMSKVLMDKGGVYNKFNVYPNQMVDYLSLVGDNSDNIPGLEKCGPKTAVKLLKEFSTLDNIISNKDKVLGKVGDNLKNSIDKLLLSRKLIILNDNVNLSNDNNLFSLINKKDSNWQYLYDRFVYFGFKQFQKEALNHIKIGDKSSPNNTKSVTNYQLIDTQEKFDILIRRLNSFKLISIDTETTSLSFSQARLIGISIAFDVADAVYIPLAHNQIISNLTQQLDMNLVLDKLKPFLEDKNLKKIGQNIKYDKHVLKNHNINLMGVAGDSMLASYLIESHLGHGLDELSLRHLNLVTTKYEDLCGKGVNQISFANVDIDQAKNYASQDADYCLRIEKKLFSQMNELTKKLYLELEIPISEILFYMERFGVLIDEKELFNQSKKLEDSINEIQNKIYLLCREEFNLNSPSQLQEILFNKLGIPVFGLKKTKTGLISTDEKSLEKLSIKHEIPRMILEFRSLSKLKSTYTDKLPLLIDKKTGRIHSNYAQAVAITGRLSSNNPNLQNIPIKSKAGKMIRKAFIAQKGFKIVSADYSQIELRIMAHLSGDKILLEAFNNNEDVHKRTASEIFHVNPKDVTPTQRRYAKTINFGLIYGMGSYGLSQALGISNMEAKDFISKYFDRYKGVDNYINFIKDFAEKNGFVETIFGRKLYLPNIKSNNSILKSAAHRAAVNAPMQGTASDLVKMSMVKVFDFIVANKLNSKLIMQVHDELVLEVDEKELSLVNDKLPVLMSSVANLKVPLLVDIGYADNWGDAH